MVLQKDHDRIARWGVDKWIVEDRVVYCWTDIKGTRITGWFDTFNDALNYLISVA